MESEGREEETPDRYPPVTMNPALKMSNCNGSSCLVFTPTVGRETGMDMWSSFLNTAFYRLL